VTAATVALSRPQTLALRRLYRDGRWRRGVSVCTPWGRGVGKSTFLRMLAYLLVAAWDGRTRPGADKPGVRIVIVLPTLRQAKRIHVTSLLVELATRWKALGGHWNGTDFSVTFPGGSWIQFVSAEQGNAIAGIRCDAIFADECDDIDIEMYDALAAPWLSETHSLQLRLFSGTPRRGRYGLLYKRHRLGAIDREPGSFSYHATYRDVPEYVDHAYVESERRTMDPALFAREWLCDFDSAEGLVFPMFSADLHVRPARIDARPTSVLVGVDHGWEDPGVFEVIEVFGSGRDAIAHVVYEVYAQHKQTDWWVEQAREIRERWPMARWYADPSRPDRISELRTQAGVRIEGAVNAIEDGVATVANMLAVRENESGAQSARLYIDPSCTNLINEMGLYRRKRDPRNADRITEDIQDRDNHCADSLRYGLHTAFGKPGRSAADNSSGYGFG
jgi:hypothetical protein